MLSTWSYLVAVKQFSGAFLCVCVWCGFLVALASLPAVAVHSNQSQTYREASRECCRLCRGCAPVEAAGPTLAACCNHILRTDFHSHGLPTTSKSFDIPSAEQKQPTAETITHIQQHPKERVLALPAIVTVMYKPQPYTQKKGVVGATPITPRPYKTRVLYELQA